MLIAVIADPHANLPALQAVMEALEKESPERSLCAGDLIGYNPHPNEVIAKLRDNGFECISGNHDRAVLTGDFSWFNEVAAEALRWTSMRLTEESRTFLSSLPTRLRSNVRDVSIAMFHGSPRDDDEYVMPYDASDEFVRLSGSRVTLLGHTHVPMLFRYPSGVLANPGSVGQPRDEDPRSSYAFLETKSMEFTIHRVEYDIDAVAEDIRKEDLPEVLAERLYAGW